MKKQNELHPKPEHELFYTMAGLPSTFVVDDGDCFASSAFATANLGALLSAIVDDPGEQR
jgi:hypothetical protein